MSANELITYKHNSLISVMNCKDIKHYDKLSHNQMKVVNYSAYNIGMNDDPHKVYKLPYAVFQKLAKLKGNNHEDLYQECKKLADLGMDLITNDGAILICKWLNEVKVGNGQIEYKIDSRLLPFYKAINSGNFTKINLRDYMPLQSKHSLKIYEMMAMWANRGTVKLTILQLRTHLEIGEKQYEAPRDFLIWCVQKPIEEINRHAMHAFKVDYSYEYGLRKSVKAIIFVIRKIDNNPDDNDIVIDSDQPEARSSERPHCPECSTGYINHVANGKHGEFWNCTNYPKCKFKTNYNPNTDSEAAAVEKKARKKKAKAPNKDCPDCRGEGWIYDLEEFESPVVKCPCAT